jgi:hypothetical protein
MPGESLACYRDCLQLKKSCVSVLIDYVAEPIVIGHDRAEERGELKSAVL